jgi:hypothetical protein
MKSGKVPKNGALFLESEQEDEQTVGFCHFFSRVLP